MSLALDIETTMFRGIIMKSLVVYTFCLIQRCYKNNKNNYYFIKFIKVEVKYNKVIKLVIYTKIVLFVTF